MKKKIIYTSDRTLGHDEAIMCYRLVFHNVLYTSTDQCYSRGKNTKNM